MRLLLLGLILLAGLKIWIQDSVYRAATEHALIAAYFDRAVIACKSAEPGSMATLPQGFAVDWSQEREHGARISIGNSAITVPFWEIGSEEWNARFRRAYLILETKTAGLACAYDIAAATATISQL